MRGELIEIWDFIKLKFEDEPWIISKLLRPQGKILMAGEEKVGKSVLALSLAISLSQGSPVWGIDKFDCKPCSVLYMQTEVGKFSLQERAIAYLRTKTQGEGEVWLYNMKVMYIDQDEEAQAEMHEVIRQCAPDVLILDPLSDLIAGDDNKATDAKKLTSFLQSLVEEYQLSIVLIHHTGKPGENSTIVSRGQHASRGSTEFTRWSNSNIIVTNAGDYGDWRRLRLHFNLRDSAPINDLYIEYNKNEESPDALTLRVCDMTPAEANLNKVLVALRDGSLSQKHLVEKLMKGGMGQSLAYSAVRQARVRGLVRADDKMISLPEEENGKESKDDREV